MLEELGRSVIFYAFYTEDGAGDTGLTVTVDVWEVTRNGTATEIVTGGSATEVGDGIYRYLLAAGSVDAEAEYIAVFKTADSDTDQQHIPAIWVINRANVEDIDDILTDTGTTIPGTITTIDNEIATIDGIVDDILEDTGTTLPAEIEDIDEDVWTYPDRRLTQSATSITSSVSGSEITQTRGDSWTIEVTELTLDSNYIQFAIKRYASDDDDEALLLIDTDTGLVYLNGASGTAGDGSLSYEGTTLTITVKASATAQLPTGQLKYGIQSISSEGTVLEPYGGTFNITSDIIRDTDAPEGGGAFD